MTVKLLIYSLTVMQKAAPRRMHSQALRHYLTVLTQSLRGSNKNADKSALTKNDLKREKLAIQSALTGRLFQTLINLWLKYHLRTLTRLL
jgi:ribosome-associated toxin RatA of RatAB toxin-antitoxin module